MPPTSELRSSKPAEYDNRNTNDEELPKETRRLSRMQKPRIGSVDAAVAKPQNDKINGKGKGRNDGKLAQLIHMPLDIFFEIASRLMPIDVLHLSMASKEFRSTFASQNSRHIWMAARKNIPNLPDCPTDLSEPQYAALVFGRHCQACGKDRARSVDYSLRIRFCGPCFRSNVKTGHSLIKASRGFGSLIEVIGYEGFKWVPRSFFKHEIESTNSVITQSFKERWQPENNTHTHHYYAPELETMSKAYWELPSGPESRRIFVAQQKVIAAQIMSHALLLQEWENKNRTDQCSEENRLSTARENSIISNLLELGYQESEFPQAIGGSRWRAILCQPRELSPRIWSSIRPELEQLIFEAKVQRESEARYNRKALRIGEFKLFWAILEGHIGEPLPGDIHPTFNQSCELPCVKAMLSEDDWRVQVTQQRVEAILVNGNGNVNSDVVSFQANVRRSLVRLLQPAVNLESLQGNLETAQLSDDASNRRNLGRAYNFFNLPIIKFIECNDVISPYPQALSHSSLRSDSYHATWEPEILSKMVPKPRVKEVAILLMQKLGLNPEEATHSELDELDGRLMCKCDKAGFGGPTGMNWADLVMHYLDDKQYTTHYQRLTSTSACVSISPTRLPPPLEISNACWIELLQSRPTLRQTLETVDPSGNWNRAGRFQE